MKDSREISDFTREEILSAIEKSKSDNIIITHGTYTMVETAKFIKTDLARTIEKRLFFGH